ncbi:MAG TPA: toll/interleukin-1 receptor domain-containing protein [Verrucomicrobiota bacterium]|nr:hypothetical protein [Verrucomicrobiales bacterium]HRI13844.1 toll/interleukin-1 receptor domain-containing protein [Verrucomicrobiota bacterium]
MAEALPPEPRIIFINYRRTDAGWPADLLASSLEQAFGKERVFLDVRGIEAGEIFAAELEEKLHQAAVLIVLIGKGWLHAEDKYGRRRIDQPDDWVRHEIRFGLRHCRVIPVLIDDAELPDDREALPEDIAELLGRQRRWLRQASSEDDIEALTKELEKAGIQRSDNARGVIQSQDYHDPEVSNVAKRLEQLRLRGGTEFVARRELLQELDQLFNRKTFRFEALRECPEQRWADRLDSAYQTKQVLREWERNVRAVASDKYQTYVELLKEVGSYCMQMGALLFEPSVDYNRIKDHIGETSFKAQLPPEIRFPADSAKRPIIPDLINDAIERHRKRAVSRMDKLAKE